MLDQKRERLERAMEEEEHSRSPPSSRGSSSSSSSSPREKAKERKVRINRVEHGDLDKDEDQITQNKKDDDKESSLRNLLHNDSKEKLAMAEMSKVSSSKDDGLSIDLSRSDSDARSGFGKEETAIEKEEREDILKGSLEQILMKLEKKGQKNKIFKYVEMQELRSLRNIKV